MGNGRDKNHQAQYGEKLVQSFGFGKLQVKKKEKKDK